MGLPQEWGTGTSSASSDEHLPIPVEKTQAGYISVMS